MLKIEIPRTGLLEIKHLVLDFNGTLSVDGRIKTGVKEKLFELGKNLEVHVITADTFGKARKALIDVNCQLHILPPDEPHDELKLKYVEELRATNVCAIGNGSNDALMLAEARLGIAVLMEEGLSKEAFLAADILVKDINDALELLLNPLRLKATLRR
ncbi:HAD family hydrolase [Thermodesulfatator autotrophicus]|uniref:ATPase P n=1 Tax=Thermodesulfatator autotrophicus TaxID=1795632 RepID=A0A177EB31_9BACT|nr:HAD family hydrolase [Thermodesulfatator autotrophicus]OAG28392.1 ATPase P [Thermodesulfatator autotrophicus]